MDMATDLERKSPTSKYQSFIDQQIGRVRRRIRMFDVGSALLGLVVTVLGYALIMAILDRTFALPVTVRLIGLAVGVFTAGYFLVLAFVRLGRRVSLHYAARQLERTMPDAKNSVINWLDLRDEKLPPVIRTALSHKAAKDLKQADAEQAVSGNMQWMLTAAAVVLLFALLVMLFTGPAQFMSLMTRAFTPFRDITIATRTTIALVTPAGGNANVPINTRVDIRAQIHGPVGEPNTPTAPQLHFRYSAADELVALPLLKDADGAWSISMQADQVQNGFSYQITAGDSTTPEYQVTVYTIPQVTEFELVYKYRPYRVLPDLTVVYPNDFAGTPTIRGHQGTQVRVIARTNRVLQDARLEMRLGKAEQQVIGEILADDPNAAAFNFTLEQEGTFRVRFKSTEGQENHDISDYPILVLPDGVPVVRLTKPGKDIELPANGTLALEGLASDDFGIRRLTLRMRVLDNPAELEAKEYRPEKSFRFGNDTYPDFLDYVEVVPLDQLKNIAGKPFPLRKGMVLEYRLEARDNFDFPNNQIGSSDAFKVTILDSNRDEKKQQDERSKAEKDRSDKQKDQDNQLKNENDKRTPPPNPELEKKRKELEDKLNKLKDTSDAPRDDAAKNNPDQGQPDKNHGTAKSDQQKNDKPDEQKSEKKDGNAGNDAESGQAKDAKGNEGKQAGQEKQAGEKSPQAGQEKDGGEKKQPENTNPQENQPNASEQGQPKDSGDQKNGASAKQGEARDGGQPKPDSGPKASADKNESPSANNKPGSEKNAGASKQGPGSEQKQPADAKSGEKAAPKDVAQSKEGADQTPQADDANSKSAGEQAPRSASKDEAGKAEPKSDAKQGPGDQVAQAKEQGKEPGAEPGSRQAESNPAAAKGEPTPAEQKGGGSKEGADRPQANSKNGQGGKETAQGDAKQTPPQQAERAAEGKGEKGAGGTARKEPTAEEVARQNDELEKGARGDAEQQKRAEETLRRIRDEAKDPKVREAADEALRKNNRDDARVKGNQGQADEKQQGEKKELGPMQGDQQPGGAAKDQGSDKGKAPKPGEGKSNPSQENDPQFTEGESKGGRKAGSGPGGDGINDTASEIAADPANERRGGELNLEVIKKKISDDVLKKANMTREQWEQFQRDVAEYERLRLQHQTSAEKLVPGEGRSQLQSQRVRSVGTANDARLDPLQGGNTYAPPEFREPQRRFTSKLPQQPAP